MYKRALMCLAASVIVGSTMISAAADETVQAPIPAEFMAQMSARMGAGGGGSELQPFDEVSKGYKKVISTADGKPSLYTVWTKDKEEQIIAELPRGFEKQKLFLTYTVASGNPMAGIQLGDRYVHWKRFGNQLALIEPNVAVRTTGDFESRKGLDRAFTDRVLLDVPILANGPGGGPVIDVDELLVSRSSEFFGLRTMGAKTSLATIAKAKAFPENLEFAFEMPMPDGRFGTIYYSIRHITPDKSFKPRVADTRIGFFTTSHQDLGSPDQDTPWVRYVNRWKLEKADPKLKLSPPKEPIVFYLEHTIPVRYRRWVRDGVLEWNKAFENIGIVNAVEVYQQDARTGAHMEKDPEDARFNFLLWTNAPIGFAIGPSRVNPETGQILDADIVMSEGFIRGWSRVWQDYMPQVAMEGFGPDTFAWLNGRPDWDPRVLLAPLAEREDVKARLAREYATAPSGYFAGHPAANADPTLLGDDQYDGLYGRVSQVNGGCMHAATKSLDVGLFRLDPNIFIALAASGDDEDDDADDDDAEDDDNEADDEDEDDDHAEPKPPTDMLDGVPDWFIGPLLKDVIMHEVGHTLGLRHNFKASSIYSLEEINSEDMKGKAQTGSVMDYNPINVNFGDGPVQGDYTMVTIGKYDYWAIEYGYTTAKDLKPILARVAEEHLPYATDEDTWGPDPLARRFDYGANPLDYADSQIRLADHLRDRIVEEIVKDGDSWSKARRAYNLLLGRQFGAIAIAANWLGGAHVNRDHKGDPGARKPIEVVSADQQRRALNFVIDNAFHDEAFGLTPELLSHLTVDKWWDDGGFGEIFEDPTWPVHQRIGAIQSTALTMVLNPTSLNRVYDNEFRLDEEEDALTLPEVIFTVSDDIWTELDEANGQRYTARKPMISSLRRNLQREHIKRMIDLSMPNDGFGAAAKPVSNLCMFKLRQIESKISDVLEAGDSRIDPYTIAHLSEAQVRIEKALDADYIYNLDDINVNFSLPFLFGEEARPNTR